VAVQIQGNGGTIAEVDGGQAGTDARALRCVARPTAVGTLGHYSYGGFTGVIAAAIGANSELFQFRWSDATRLALIRKVWISASVSTTMFAAGVPVQVDLVKSTAWTVSGTGGTAVAPAALLKKRTSMGSSLVGDIRIATTAALGAGTKTLETLSLGALLAGGPITASLNGTIFAANSRLLEAEIEAGEYPLTLAQNEGFSIRAVAVPGTGTWTMQVHVDWAEVAAY
jgi:hypothetical protein